MRTLSEWLRDSDRTELIRLYLDSYPVNFARFRDSKMTVAEIMQRCEQRVDAFITELLSYEPGENREMVFLATEFYRDGCPRIESVLVSVNELANTPVETYGWDVSDREDLMGYYVAETELAKKHMPEVLVYILYMASFYGYTREEFESGREDLFRSLEEAEKELRELCLSSAQEEPLAFPRSPEEKTDAHAEKLRDAIQQAESEYIRYCLDRELTELRGLLAAYRNND